MTHRRIAVIDIGKTNAKLALVDAATLRELAVETRPNTVLPGPPWPHFDLDGHWDFLLDALTRMQAEHGIDAISVTTHGAAAVLLDKDGALAAPMLDYEHTGPDTLAAEYDAIRPPFAETGSPRLPMGLNLGAQLHWQLQDADLDARVAYVVTYPQYWGYRLTGKLATDVTSLGCHTDLWNPWTGQPSSLVETLGLTDRLAPAHHSSDVLGTITPEIAARTGLSSDTPVACGIHDSNASLYPHLAGRSAPFSVVSTGTWVIAMAVSGAPVTLDPARDTLVNVDAQGGAVPSARFMGGREYEKLRQVDHATGTSEGDLFCLPAIEPGTGPFPNRAGGFTRAPRDEAERGLAISRYLALMTDECLSLIGARGPVIVEGPFARNADYLDMLAALRGTVEASASATGTSAGGALLLVEAYHEEAGRAVTPSDSHALRAYAAAWKDRIGSAR
ncbi:Sugar (pentulose or hexulose) kinase [Palleronia marisminoris]|uniref:Rhamnulokinase n=1 Tax=Palleronia marisminoris TaxID=315423 RepID=A0A1Y5RKT9_9RHOB|nr:FGGY-family carbohydrate kinase [Palleronia marisminoris]SFG25177.1 Sugar (pentulose or hexulose) kinase [Palleronia marisminoris]SLN19540.1 Rhamnulokinase [Palleronia marisminoris]